MRLSRRRATRVSRPSNYLSRRFTSRQLPLLVVLLLTVAAVFVFVARSRAAHGRTSATAERATTIVERNLRGAPALHPLAPPATTFTVNDLGDTGDATLDGVCDDGTGKCTLRAAIQEANSVAGADTIGFSVTGTIQLGGVLPDISTDITINGPGAKVLTVNRNVAPRFGIFYVHNNATAFISDLTVTNGFAFFGGGIRVGNTAGDAGALTLTRVAVTGNTASSAAGGGGIFLQLGTLNVIESTISGNLATSGSGGGINAIGTLSVVNTTISGNKCIGGGAGGGVWASGSVTLSNSTIAGNSAGQGGGLRVPGTLTLKSTLIGDNTANSRPDLDDENIGTINSEGYNLIENTSGATINVNPGAGPDITGQDPLLGPLQDNGGPTKTHALLPGSPAIDKGESFGLTTDQRGQTRPFDDPSIAPASNMADTGDNSDIGAYEVIGVVETGGPSLVVNSIADTSDGACTAEPGGCTLREAIQTANSLAGANTITFDPALTSGGAAVINLTSALPDLSTDITINGPGANLLTVRRNTGGDYRIFTIDPGVTSAISGLTIANGHLLGNGGGIFNDGGTLTITNSTLSSNFADGGGIYNTGTVTITNSTLSGNSSAFQGGGIYNESVGTLTITNSTLSGNSSSANGGGIQNNGTATITNSTLAGNSASSKGGGIYNPGGTVTITNSTLAGNSADNGLGGGIHNGGTVTITNSTLSANSAFDGGGILNFFGTVMITNSTLSGNSADTGGGISNAGAGTVNARSTIIGQNTATTGRDISGALTSLGHNLIGASDGSTGFTNGVNNDKVGTVAAPLNALLAPLGNYGGPTQTRALLPGSPAIDAGDDCVFNNTCSPVLGFALTTDQRGGSFSRQLGAHVDIGAYEVNGVLETGGPSFVVNSIADTSDGACTAEPGGCTLREAISTANALAGTDTITFDPALTAGGAAVINLTGALPDLSTDISINGPGANLLTVRRNTGGDYSIFNISSGVTAAIDGLTIANGKNGNGGGILNSGGTVTLTNSALSGNSASAGGGIFNKGGSTLTINNSTLSGNSASSGGKVGGGIFNAGTVTITNSTLSGNSSDSGGGIHSEAGTLTINNSTLSGNSASGGFGGGIENAGAGTATITNSTLSGNSSAAAGGGIFNNAGTVTTTNSTLSGNSSSDFGGGIYNNGGTVNARSTIIAQNTAPSGGPDVFATLTSQGHNLIGDNSDATIAPATGDQIGTSGSPIDPKLGPLQNNGGLTQTRVLLPGSPAIDAGDDCVLNNTCSPLLGFNLTTDQRDFARQVGAHVDIGAVEVNYAISATAGTPQSTSINTAFATQLQATVTESGNPASGITVTFTAPGSGASGTFPGNLTTVNVATNASGVAMAPVFTANGTAGGPYNPVASIGAGLPTANFALTNLPENQFITVNTHAPGSATFNTSFTVAATASSGLPVVYSSAGVCTNVGPTFTMTSGVGTCMVKYDQPGDSNNNPAPQIVETVTAQKATQTITFGALAGKTFGDPDFMISATASSGLPVSFSASGNCTVTSPSPGTVHITGGGSCTITASQGGNASYDTAPQVSQSFNIGKANQTITFGPLTTKKFGDADFNVSATASSGLPVSFTATGNCSVSGNTVHLTGAGSCTITASQAGNANYNAAPSVARSFEIDKADQTANVLPQNLPNRTFGDPDFNITGGASSDLPVTFSATGNCTVTPGGAPNSATVHLTGAGSCSLTATQAGNANYNPATGSQTFQINKANQTITFGPLANRTFGDADFNVSATASSGLPVSFTATGNCSITGNTLHLTNAGSCTITASQAGDANYNAAPSVPQTFTINKANQTITFGALANKTFGDADFNVSATASSGLTVSFTATGNCTIAGNTVHLTGVGSCTITAGQAGDANYNAAPSVPQTFTINKANQTITFGALANKTFGDADFNVSATASSGLPVSFTATGNCSITGNTLHLTGAGSCTVTASQPGNANFNAAPNVPQSFTIAKAATTTSLTSSVNPSAFGQSVTFTATVNPAPNTTTPTGTVQFKDGGANLGAAVSLNASGVATLTTSSLTAGTHAITAEYSGNTNFTLSTGSLSQLVNNRALLKFSQSSYHVGEDGKFITITVNRSGDLTPAVTVDYASPDDSASMTFLPCSTVIGIASSRCDFTTAIGTLRFAAGETSKTFDVLISQDTYVEGPETFPLTLANPTGGAAFAQPADASAVVTIDDDDSGGVVGELGITESNPIDDNQNFVRQHYHDFLNREPDAAGLSFWTSQITNCGANQACIDAAKVSVSASFFLSIEFQQTGYFVERTYKSGFSDIAPPTIPVPVRFIDFLRDTQEVGRGVVVGQGQWQAQLDANKRAFALAFVQRPDFLTKYPANTSALTFVSSLNTNAGSVLTAAEQTALIASLAPNPADATLRSNVLFQVTENQKLQQQESNRAFVLMEYFGYLRRNPDAAPDSDFTGFNFWLGKLNQANGDFIKAEMVKAFLTSNEYRQRFGP